jgi:macrolide transport system ATP-binding/permease protein
MRFAFWNRTQRNRELDEEIHAHLSLAEQEASASGKSSTDARISARHEFGSVAMAEEITRDMWGWRWFSDLGQDLRFGLRMLRRSPGFSAIAIICLALAIGANAAVYSWIEGILFRPFPAVAHQEKLFALPGTARGEEGFTDVSWPDFLDYRRSCTLVDSFIAEKIVGVTLSIGERSERVTGSVVSANYFDALGVRPILGRGFQPSEEVGRNSHPVAVISYQTWKNRYSSDPNIVGKTQRMNGIEMTIVGVAPENFYGTFVGYAFQFWVPASMQEKFEQGIYKLEDRNARWIEGFARLKPGVSQEQGQAEISAVAHRLENDFPTTNRGRSIMLMPLWKTPFNNAGTLLPTLRIALAVVSIVLLIACANIGNLLLVRAFARRHEMTVRLSVGAGRGRLIRQLLTEGFVLSALAAAGGLVIANWCRNGLVLFFPSRGVSGYLPAEFDWRVLALSGSICLVATLLFALAPAMHASKIDLAAAMKSDSGGVVGGRGKATVRSGLVLVQVSLSFVSLVGAGLLLQSLVRMRNTDPGFSTQDVVSTGFNLFADGSANVAGADPQRARNFQDELIDRIQAVPGVDSAAFARILPFGLRSYSSAPIGVIGFVPPADEQPTAEYDEVGPSYFATLGIPMISGREFTRLDNEAAAPVAIVNETLAAQYWPGKNPLGELLHVDSRWMKVVGVAKLSKYRNFSELPRPFFYVPMRQNFSPQVSLVIRTRLSAQAVSTSVAQNVRALNPGMPLSEVISMRETVNRSTWSQRAAVILLSVFGGMALLLAAIGLYGVMSSAVAQSKRELGLRMALGASAGDVLRIVLSDGLALTGCGVLLGAIASLGLARLIGDLLYKISPRDPLTFVGAFSVMAIASLAACIFPAWRAMRVDPASVLRAE